MVGYSYRFWATIVAVHSAGRTGCRSLVLWWGWWKLCLVTEGRWFICLIYLINNLIIQYVSLLHSPSSFVTYTHKHKYPTHTYTWHTVLSLNSTCKRKADTVFLILIHLPNKRTSNCTHFSPHAIILFFFRAAWNSIMDMYSIFGNPFICWWTSKLSYFLAVWDYIAVNMDNQLFLWCIGLENSREIYVVQLGYMVVLFNILGIFTPSSVVAIPVHLCMAIMGFFFSHILIITTLILSDSYWD